MSTSQIYRLSYAVAGNEPMRPVSGPCEVLCKNSGSWHWHAGTLTNEELIDVAYTHWRPSQPERAADFAERVEANLPKLFPSSSQPERAGRDNLVQEQSAMPAVAGDEAQGKTSPAQAVVNSSDQYFPPSTMDRWNAATDEELNRLFAREFWNRPIDERNGTYWHDDDKTPEDDNHEWKSLPNFCNDWSAVRPLLLRSPHIQPVYRGRGNTERDRCRRTMIFMLTTKSPSAPSPSAQVTQSAKRCVACGQSADTYMPQCARHPVLTFEQSANPDERAMACAREARPDLLTGLSDDTAELMRLAAIIAKHYAPAPSTPEGLREAVERAVRDSTTFASKRDRERLCKWVPAAIPTAIAPFIPASTTEGRTP